MDTSSIKMVVNLFDLSILVNAYLFNILLMNTRPRQMIRYIEMDKDPVWLIQWF